MTDELGSLCSEACSDRLAGQVKMNISGINFNGSMWKVVAGNCAMDSSHCALDRPKAGLQVRGVGMNRTNQFSLFG